MANENSGLPDDILQALDRASRLAAAIDKAITAAVPDIVDLQVAADPKGSVVISGVVSSVESQRRAEEVGRAVEGVERLIGSLTVIP
jgi:hypothetical protein